MEYDSTTKQTIDRSNDMDESQMHHAKWNKEYSRKTLDFLYDFVYMKFWKRQN